MALQIKTNIANVKQPPDILKYHEFRKPTFHQHNIHHCNEDRGKVLELFLKKLFSRTISWDPRNLTAKTRYSRGEVGQGRSSKYCIAESNTENIQRQYRQFKRIANLTLYTKLKCQQVQHKKHTEWTSEYILLRWKQIYRREE